MRFGDELDLPNALTAGAARLVVDEDVPARAVDQLGLDDARHRIGRAAGREGHDDLDRSLGPVADILCAHDGGYAKRGGEIHSLLSSQTCGAD
jgi:hypothetical protein